MRALLRRWAKALADAAHDHPKRFILLALVASGVALWGTSHLRINQDLKSFLPPDAKSVTRLEKLRARIGAQTDLLITIASPDPKANIAYGNALAKRMSELKELRFVIFKRDISYFERHALLYLPVKDLLDLRKKVLRRIKKEVAKKLIVDFEDDDDEGGKGKATGKGAGDKDGKGMGSDGLDFDPQERIAKVFGGAETPSSYVQNKDGTLLVIKARPIKQTTDVGFTKTLVKTMKRLIAETKPRSFHPELQAHVAGEYAERLRESRSIFGQVVITGAVAAGLLLVMIGGYFRSPRAIPIVLLPVVVSVFATFAAGALIYGSFNLATAFIFAILLGLGVDFSIHALARYRFERQRGRGTRPALRLSIASTGAAVAAGAITSVSVFWLLQLGRFRGFSQFGMMAGIGVLLALIATFTLVPSLVAALERCLPSRIKETPLRPFPTQAGSGASGGKPRGRWLAALIVLASIGTAGFGLLHANDVAFEYDFNKLGRKAPKQKAKVVKPKRPNYRHATGQAVSYAPAVAMCRTTAQCSLATRLLAAVRSLDDKELARLRAVKKGEVANPKPPAKAAAPKPSPADDDLDDDDLDDDDGGDPNKVDDGAFAALRAAYGGGKLLPEQVKLLAPFDVDRLAYMKKYLRGFLSLQTFVPTRQRDKLRIIADIKSAVDKKRGALSEETRQKLDKWYGYLEVKERVTEAALPRWVRLQFVETDGTTGRFLVLWNGGAKRDYRHSKKLYEVYFDLDIGAAAKVPMAANYFVLAELIDTLKADGPVVFGAAAAAVFVALLVLFRSPRGALLVAIPLVCTIAWLLGIYWIYSIKLNIFSVIVLPLLIGMAVDNGIHIYHRYLETREVRTVLREVGGPIALTTATTFVGFSSLLIADHVGVQTLGLAAALGMLLGLIGAVITLPALLALLGPLSLPGGDKRATDDASSTNPERVESS